MTSSIEGVQKFVEALSREYQAHHERHWGNENLPFVTISRQTGAGGHTLAETVLHKMGRLAHRPLFHGWGMFDKEICQMVAEHPKLRVSIKALVDKEFRTELEDWAAQTLAHLSPQSEVLRETFRLMRALAAGGRVILVGRAGACLTRAFRGGVHVRLVAPLPVRLRRMKALLHLEDREVEALVKEKDAARASLVKKYFYRDIDDPLLYDVVLNTEHFSLGMMSDLILRLVEARIKESGGADILPAGSA